MQVTVYTRVDCAPCEDVIAILRRLGPEYGLSLSVVELESLPEAHHVAAEEAPIVAIEGGELGRLGGPRTEAQLRVALEIARLASGRSAYTSVPAVASPKSRIDRWIETVAQHWLRFAVTGMGLYVGLPWLAPVFAAFGWWQLADPIYTAYAFT